MAKCGIRLQDVHKFNSIDSVLRNIDGTYYLIHSMAAGEEDFVEMDKDAAEKFSRKAKTASVKRII